MNRRSNSAMPKSLIDDEVIITQSTTERISLQGNGGSGKSLTAVHDEGFGHQCVPDSGRFEALLDSTAAAKLRQIHPKTLQKLARVGSRYPATNRLRPVAFSRLGTGRLAEDCGIFKVPLALELKVRKPCSIERVINSEVFGRRNEPKGQTRGSSGITKSSMGFAGAVT